MLHVRLDPGLPQGRWARLRPLQGRDEQSLAAAAEGATAVVELLDRLLVEAPGTSVGPGRAWELAVSDRDRLLAAVYAATFGDQIESVVPCEHCGEGSELGFSLAALVESLAPEPNDLAACGLSGPDEAGVYTLADGLRFRLPSSADQRALLDTRSDQRRVALLRRCIVADAEPGAARTPSDLSAEILDRVESAMEIVGPTVARTLNLNCHECGVEQSARFDIQHFLLRALAHERRFLMREIHYLASSYGWSLDEILGLSRDDRRTLVGLVAAASTARNRRSLR